MKTMLGVTIDNPWKNFSYSRDKENVIDMDKPFVQAYKNYIKCKWGRKRKYKDNAIHLEICPEPFIGSPDASIYLLGGNPGYDGKDHECNSDESLYIQLMSKTLIHECDFLFFRKELKEHKGNKWWMTHVKENLLRNNIFNIEYFPYHSHKADGLKSFLNHIRTKKLSLTCGSNEYANWLIKKAIESNKIIIITRLRNFWLERIKALREYSNSYILLDAQTARINEGNIVKFSDFCKLKTASWKEINDKITKKN